MENQEDVTKKIHEAMREMTLALMFLSRWTEKTKKDKKLKEPWRAWKGYDFGDIDKLEEADYIRGSRRAKSAVLTPKGMAEARKILEKYGIPDWPSLKDFADWPEDWPFKEISNVQLGTLVPSTFSL